MDEAISCSNDLVESSFVVYMFALCPDASKIAFARAVPFLADLGVAALGLAACTGGTSSSSSADAEQTYGPGALPTVTDGKLTVATSDPAYSPWILNNDPASGEGYESAVIYALAEELGYTADNVQWVRATFDASITPGAKDWDSGTCL